MLINNHSSPHETPSWSLELQWSLGIFWKISHPSSHNHGSGKWVHSILVSFHFGGFYTSMIMGGRVKFLPTKTSFPSSKKPKPAIREIWFFNLSTCAKDVSSLCRMKASGRAPGENPKDVFWDRNCLAISLVTCQLFALLKSCFLQLLDMEAWVGQYRTYYLKMGSIEPIVLRCKLNDQFIFTLLKCVFFNLMKNSFHQVRVVRDISNDW